MQNKVSLFLSKVDDFWAWRADVTARCWRGSVQARANAQWSDEYRKAMPGSALSFPSQSLYAYLSNEFQFRVIGNPKEHVNRIIEELISAKKDELTPTDILHVLLSMGRKEYTDVALRCHERCYFRKDRSISDDESRTEKTKRNSKTVVEVMI